jgi:hypothetical protein
MRLREASVKSFCSLLERHPHFNFRANILQMVAAKLAIKDRRIRDECTNTVSALLKKDDDGLLPFKLDILKEIHKVLKTKDHSLISASLLDSLVLHDIMVDETKARAIDESSKKSQEMHDKLRKLRKKGKLHDYKELK